MTPTELFKMVDWLRDTANQMEKDEPYATTTIRELRAAAQTVESAQPDEEDPD